MDDPLRQEIFVPHVGWLTHPPDDRVGRFLAEGWFEYREQALWWLYLREGDSVVDVGAHAGLYTALAARLVGRRGRVLSVEADPANLAWLRRNIEEHGSTQCQAVHAAMTSVSGEIDYFPGAATYAAYGHTRGGEPANTGSPVRVPACTFDQLSADSGFDDVALAKIDVEGDEIEVLKGAGNAIAHRRVQLWMVEFAEENLASRGASTRELFDLCSDLGFTVCRFDEEQLCLVPFQWDGPVWWENLFLAAHPSLVNQRLAHCSQEHVRIARDIVARGLSAATMFGSASRQPELERARAEKAVRRADDSHRRAEGAVARAEVADRRAGSAQYEAETARRRLGAILASPAVRSMWKLRLVRKPAWADESLAVANELGPPQVAAADSRNPMNRVLYHLVEKGFRPNAILDAGAAKGYWSLNTHSFFPNADYFLVDPLEENSGALERIAADHSRFHYVRAALGRVKGSAFLKVGPDLDGSHLLPPGRTDGRLVSVFAADELLDAGLVRPPAFIKIDVQGSEMNLLLGADRTLESCEVLIVEVNLFRFQPEWPLAHEVIAHIAAKGFVLFDIAGQLRRPFEDDLGQIDLVFAAATSPLVANSRWN